jgi:hypothetical protein
MKHIWDLTEEDLIKNPVWYFPMEGEETDETNVHPASESEAKNMNNMLLVSATFKESTGKKHKGFIYWSKPEVIENLQPCVFYGSGKVSFWYGIVEPEAEGIIIWGQSKFTLTPLCFDLVMLCVLTPVFVNCVLPPVFWQTRVRVCAGVPGNGLSYREIKY